MVLPLISIAPPGLATDPMNVWLPPPRTMPLGEAELLRSPPVGTLICPLLTKSLTLAVPLTVIRPLLVLVKHEVSVDVRVAGMVSWPPLEKLVSESASR